MLVLEKEKEEEEEEELAEVIEEVLRQESVNGGASDSTSLVVPLQPPEIIEPGTPEAEKKTDAITRFFKRITDKMFPCV